MPNYCYNKLVITGDKTSLKQFKQIAQQNDDDFLQNLHPMPEHIDIEETNNANPGWYKWRLANWGTKWDVRPDTLEDSDNQIIYSFESAWSPPTDAFQFISKNYPTLSFFMQFEENGADFIGQVTYKNGVELELKQASYQEQAKFHINIEKVFLEQNVLSIELNVVYKENKWDFDSHILTNNKAIIELNSGDKIFNFDDIEHYKPSIKAENIFQTRDDLEYVLEYYIEENIDEIQVFYEKTVLESKISVAESKENNLKI